MEEFIAGLNETKPQVYFIDCAKYIDEPCPPDIKAKFRSPDVEVPTLELDPEWERLASQTEGEKEFARRKGPHPVLHSLPDFIDAPPYSKYETEMLTKQDEIIKLLNELVQHKRLNEYYDLK